MSAKLTPITDVNSIHRLILLAVKLPSAFRWNNANTCATRVNRRCHWHFNRSWWKFGEAGKVAKWLKMSIESILHLTELTLGQVRIYTVHICRFHNTRARMHTHKYTYENTRTRTHTHTNTHIRTHTQTLTYTYACMDSRTHIDTHVHKIYKQAYAYIGLQTNKHT